MLTKPLSRVLFLCVLGGSAAFGQTSEPAPVLPPPSSGLPVWSANDLFSAPRLELLPDPVETEGAFEETIAEGFLSAPVVVERLPRWYEPVYWFGPTPWDIGIEFGLNGSEGVNQSLSLHSGGHVKRKTKDWKLDSSLAYNKNSANSVETQHNALFDLRVDRRLHESPWSLFFLHQTLYEEFQAFDLRVSVSGGLGYEIVSSETINLLGRFGGGTSREFGGPDNQWAPEALFGLEYEHQVTKMQRLLAKLDYYPHWDDFNQYRVVSDVGWEIELDHPRNLRLKFAVVDRYDSTPNGVQPNELNYSALLIWGL